MDYGKFICDFIEGATSKLTHNVNSMRVNINSMNRDHHLVMKTRDGYDVNVYYDLKDKVPGLIASL